MNNTPNQHPKTAPFNCLSLISSVLLVLAVAPQIALANNQGQINPYTTTPVAQQGASDPISKPYRGMNMSQVEAQFGYPNQDIAPAGTPPIARWIYQGFTVYFEDQYVIHAVQHR